MRDYVCEWEGCGKGFITATRLKRHIAAHEGRETFRCTLVNCGQTFRKHGTLQKHILTVHEEKKPFVCGYLKDDGTACGEGFDTAGKLSTHTGRAHDKSRFLCTICSSNDQMISKGLGFSEQKTEFSTHAELQAHLAKSHPPTCIECKSTCRSQRDLKNHFELLHWDLGVGKRGTYECSEPGCERSFKRKGNLNAHIQATHVGKRFVCGGIEKAFLNNIGDWDESDSCGEVLTSKANLERHIRTVHRGIQKSRLTKTIRKGGDSAELRASKEYVSVLTRLTGSGYDTESARLISCLVPGCQYRFCREYDHEVHLQSRHGLADLEVQGLVTEAEDLSGQPALQE